MDMLPFMSVGFCMVTWWFSFKQIRINRRQQRLIEDLLTGAENAAEVLTDQGVVIAKLGGVARQCLGPPPVVSDDERASVQHVRICPN